MNDNVNENDNDDENDNDIDKASDEMMMMKFTLMIKII